MIKTIITIIATIISFLSGFLLKKKSQENQELKSKVNSYEKKQEDQEIVIKNSRSGKFSEQLTSAEIVINNDILISQSTGTPLEIYSIIKNSCR